MNTTREKTITVYGIFIINTYEVVACSYLIVQLKWVSSKDKSYFIDS